MSLLYRFINWLKQPLPLTPYQKRWKKFWNSDTGRAVIPTSLVATITFFVQLGLTIIQMNDNKQKEKSDSARIALHERSDLLKAHRDSALRELRYQIDSIRTREQYRLDSINFERQLGLLKTQVKIQEDKTVADTIDNLLAMEQALDTLSEITMGNLPVQPSILAISDSWVYKVSHIIKKQYRNPILRADPAFFHSWQWASLEISRLRNLYTYTVSGTTRPFKVSMQLNTDLPLLPNRIRGLITDGYKFLEKQQTKYKIQKYQNL